jgi:predicted anti-sigma-YlaC factor YlaD
MTEDSESTRISCEVISDLMVAYASGEASGETQRLVEEHLARCPACREAFGEEPVVEEALADLEPVQKPANGRRFIARTRRLLFAIGAGVLFLFACVLAVFERVVMEDIAGIPLPHLPGHTLLWLTVAATMLGLYVALLLWRRRREPGAGRGNILLSLLATIPLLIMALAVYHLVGTGTMPSVLVAVLFLLVALVITFISLPRLSYMTLATVLVLLLVNGLLVGQAVAGVVAMADYSFETPAALGHPAEGVALKEAVRLDLESLGLEWVESTEMTRVGNVWVGPQATAMRAVYEGNGRQAFLTVVEFESSQEADHFFVAWKNAVSGGVRLTHFEINLPGLPGQGRIMRAYSAQTGRAYSAWQARNWVTIVEVPGVFSQATPLSQDIKELVTGGYRSGGEE